MNGNNISSLPLCRPKMLTDEWIETYLYRVIRANGIRQPLLTDLERFRPTLPATASSNPDGYPIWGDCALPRWSVITRRKKIRYCPACLTESRHIRARWRLKLFEVCTIHHIRLKDDLAEPVMTRGYREDGRYLVTDVTDEQLWAGSVCPMPSERRHVEQLWAGFERSIIENDIPAALEKLPCILFLVALIDAIARTTTDSGYLPISVPRSTTLAKVAEQFQYQATPNIDGIRTLLDKIAVIEHRHVVLACLRRMLGDEADRPTCLSNLPVADLRMRLLDEGRQWPDTLTRGLVHPPHAVPEGYVSFEKAVLLIGCTAGFLQYLINNDTYPDAILVQRGQEHYTFLPLQEVEACRKWYASLVTREHVMSEFHIDKMSCSALRSVGLLDHVQIGPFTFFKRSSLTNICRRLEDISRPFDAMDAHLYPLFCASIIDTQILCADLIDILMKVFDGKLPIFRHLTNPGLSAYFVEQHALNQVHQLRKLEQARRRHETEARYQLSLLT
ncbi:TniQ family protein [Burkholderia thailandensis]|uniref:TniQ family protein n=1 Tax=Burkholderia thailandensis TaxID=57975 RepID=UPI0003083D4C|nr:TniQ family protein [Burkholderia thailandensis]AIS95188.1 tniQ family protein [Burkholderia thailandensis MSMB59]